MSAHIFKSKHMKKAHIILSALLFASGQLLAADAVTDIGDRLEIFVDRTLIDTMDGATLTLGQPRPEEI